MDRFIEVYEPHLQEIVGYLKSNMDRFIVHTKMIKEERFSKFKIQYG